LVVDRGYDDTEALLQRNAVVQAVRRLPRRQREVVVLRFFLDVSVAQAAAILGASEGTVKSYTARAIAQLRGLLSEEPIAAPAVVSEVTGAD
jgi:RNA polymerase sigma factor (sigma-70 family)